jgi:hypothetical protein
MVTAQLLFCTRQSPVPMRLCTRLASAKLTLFLRFSPTSGAAYRQRAFVFGCHDCILHHCRTVIWSIVTSASTSEAKIPGLFMKARFSSISASKNENRAIHGLGSHWMFDGARGRLHLLELSVIDQTLKFRGEKVTYGTICERDQVVSVSSGNRAFPSAQPAAAEHHRASPG